MRRRLGTAAVAAALAALLGGCAMWQSDGSLYRLPKLPAEYESLETLIGALLADGAEYAAPTSGSNLQSVQMVDLDGDGTEEAVAFLRRSGDEKPMKIYVFRATGDSYERYCVIEGTSSAIYSVAYTDLDGDGWREILAGSRGNLDVQNLAVYSLASGEPQQLLATGYTRYAARDMDGDGRQELIVIRSDEESMATADYYVWDGAEPELRSSLRLSSSVTELSRLTAGTLASGENALFVTGVAEENIAITDVLIAREENLQAVALGASGEVIRFADLYPADVDGDGVTEVPEPTAFPQASPEGAVYYRICWRQYDASGASEVVRETYQDAQSGWSLTLPDNWDNVTVERMSGTDESATMFLRLDGAGAEPFLTIYTFTGNTRLTQAARGGRILLQRQTEAVYAAELTEAAAGLIDEQTLRASFALIAAEWTAGEN